MTRLLYTLLWYPLAPLLLLRLGWRGRHFPTERRRWRERFGQIPARGPGLWLHAVSVGEVRAALPLIHALRTRYPEEPLLITTVTATGARQVREALGDEVQHAYLPYDLPGAVNRFLDRARPRLGIIMETELWPNLYRACQRRGIPLVLANARLSARSARGYGRIPGLIRETLAAVTVAARDDTDAERFSALGATRLQVMGNLKFDMQLPGDLPERGQQLRERLGVDRPVWIAGSTHEGEEQRLLAVHQRLLADSPGLLLILVPRHPERFQRVADLCQRQGLSIARRSRGESVGPDIAVYLGDTMGELLLLYAAADVAFVGGSLIPGPGGHNVLEPAALGKPVVFGDSVFNFADASARLLAAGAARQVADDEGLLEALGDLLAGRTEGAVMGERGRAVVAANRGALERLLALLAEMLGEVE